MRKRIGQIVNKILHPVGYTIVPVPKIIPRTTQSNWAEKLGIRTIIDIGSNEGQFIQEINTLLPGRKIFAFEPIPSCFGRLQTNTQGIDVTAYNIGLSDAERTSEINISNNLVSSSILEMQDLHKDSYPGSHFVKKETILLKRLDDVMAAHTLQENILVKMDVQGYEEKVILGGEETFAKTAAVIVESSFEPLYSGQWLFDDLYMHFTRAGFKFMGFTDQINSKKTGIPLYADSIFVRKEFVDRIL